MSILEAGTSDCYVLGTRSIQLDSQTRCLGVVQKRGSSAGIFVKMSIFNLKRGWKDVWVVAMCSRWLFWKEDLQWELKVTKDAKSPWKTSWKRKGHHICLWFSQGHGPFFCSQPGSTQVAGCSRSSFEELHRSQGCLVTLREPFGALITHRSPFQKLMIGRWLVVLLGPGRFSGANCWLRFRE